MKTSSPETWSSALETALACLLFLAPLAFHSNTFDPSALKDLVLQWSALALLGAWTLKGLVRGRWELPESLRSSFLPLGAVAAWVLCRWAATPGHLAGLPGLVAGGACGLVFLAAALELGGARSAARASSWVAGAGVLVGLNALAHHLGLLAGEGRDMGGYAAVALPVVLSCWLDPEISPLRRALSSVAAFGLAIACAESGSASGLGLFVLAAGAFAAACLALMHGPAPRKAAALAAGAAFAALFLSWHSGLTGRAATELAAAAAGWHEALRLWAAHPVVGSGIGRLAGTSPGAASPFGFALAETGMVGAVLLAWLLSSTLIGGLRAAVDLRRRGALAETGHAAGFTASFAIWALGSGLGLLPGGGPAAWTAWAAAGVAVGMAPLARVGGRLAVYPLPVSDDIRRLLHAPTYALLAALAAWPALWLSSDLSMGRASQALAKRDWEAGARLLASVRPGSPDYLLSLSVRGQALRLAGRPAESLDQLASLETQAPRFPRLHAHKAMAYAALGDWGASARERELHARHEPSEIPNLVAWAEAARAAGDVASARRAASRAEALAPEDASVRSAIAANELLERRMAQKDAARRMNGRKGTALKKSR